MLSVVWGMRLMGVLVGSVLVNQVFGSACDAGAGRADVLAGLERLTVAAPVLISAFGLLSVLGVERRTSELTISTTTTVRPPQRLDLIQLLDRLRSIPQAGRFMGVLCLFTFSMFLIDAVLEPYAAALFGMSV